MATNGHSHGMGHARNSSTASALADKSKLIQLAATDSSMGSLNARLEVLKEAGVRRVPLTKLYASPELNRLRPALRAKMADLEYLADCAAAQYPRAANGKDLALVFRVSAVLRGLNEDGVREVTSMPWHMAQMFSVVSPPTAYSTM